MKHRCGKCGEQARQQCSRLAKCGMTSTSQGDGDARPKAKGHPLKLKYIPDGHGPPEETRKAFEKEGLFWPLNAKKVYRIQTPWRNLRMTF